MLMKKGGDCQLAEGSDGEFGASKCKPLDCDRASIFRISDADVEQHRSPIPAAKCLELSESQTR